MENDGHTASLMTHFDIVHAMPLVHMENLRVIVNDDSVVDKYL